MEGGCGGEEGHKERDGREVEHRGRGGRRKGRAKRDRQASLLTTLPVFYRSAAQTNAGCIAWACGSSRSQHKPALCRPRAGHEFCAVPRGCGNPSAVHRLCVSLG